MINGGTEPLWFEGKKLPQSLSDIANLSDGRMTDSELNDEESESGGEKSESDHHHYGSNSDLDIDREHQEFIPASGKATDITCCCSLMNKINLLVFRHGYSKWFTYLKSLTLVLIHGFY